MRLKRHVAWSLCFPWDRSSGVLVLVLRSCFWLSCFGVSFGGELMDARDLFVDASLVVLPVCGSKTSYHALAMSPLLRCAEKMKSSLMRFLGGALRVPFSDATQLHAQASSETPCSTLPREQQHRGSPQQPLGRVQIHARPRLDSGRRAISGHHQRRRSVAFGRPTCILSVKPVRRTRAGHSDDTTQDHIFGPDSEAVPPPCSV